MKSATFNNSIISKTFIASRHAPPGHVKSFLEATVFIWNKAVHMDPESYPALREFDPSRWDNHVTKPGSFIPFGGGSRRCPGGDIGKLEVSIFLHYFLLNYKLEQLNPGSSTKYLPGTRPSDNFPAKVIKLK